MKSIRTRIMRDIILLVLALCILSGGFSGILNYRSASTILEKTMSETAHVASGQVSAQLGRYLGLASAVGCMPELSDPARTVTQRAAVLSGKVNSYGFTDGMLIDRDGRTVGDTVDYSGETFFQAALNGETCVSDPILDENGQLKLLAAAPIWTSGLKGGFVSGVVALRLVDNVLNDIVTGIEIGETGAAYMLNRAGDTIAIENLEKVMSNTQRDAAADPSLTQVAEMEAKMCAGEKGFASYTFGGIAECAAYAPISGTNGWSIAITVAQSEFLKEFWISIYITIGLVTMFLLVGIFITVRLSGSISRPIRRCVDRLSALAQGDLTSPVPEVKSRDEMGVLSKATGTVVNDLRAVVEDLSRVLNEMAGGNLNVEIVASYHGDLAPLEKAAEHIVTALNRTLAQLNLAADQVSAGSEQMASGAVALSQGATEQASSVQELSATLAEISAQIIDGAAFAVKARERAGMVGDEIAVSNKKMENMTEAMTEISTSSGEISKIIKTIEDIAFQTNILALNAAVEAARAGASGKGFAVVADEVRNLANKSQAASGETTALIERSLRSVGRGTEIAKEAAHSLTAVLADAQEIIGAIDKISGASKDQAEAVGQVNQGVEQISAVVQTNSASAEESAAASQELSGQAQMLKGMVAEFQLKDERETVTI